MLTRNALQERAWQWFAWAPARAARTPQELEDAAHEHTSARLRRAGGARAVFISTPKPTGVDWVRQRFFSESLGKPFTVLEVRPLPRMPRRFEVTCETRPAEGNEAADQSGHVHVATVSGPAATSKHTGPSRQEALSFAIGTYRDLEQLARERRKAEA